MEGQRQIWLVVVLVFSVLVLWVIHANTVIQVSEKRLSEAHVQWLNLLGENIQSELEGLPKSLREDTFEIYSMAERIGVHQIVILDEEAAVQVDSEGAIKAGEPFLNLGIEAVEFEKVWDGSSKVTLPYPDSPQVMLRSIFLPLFEANGKTLGVVRISIEVPPPPEKSEAATTNLLLKLFGTVVGLVVLVTVFRVVRGTRKAPKLAQDETGTMIEAFHGVVQQLKEKEQELESLKQQAEQHAADVESYNENILQSVASGVITFDQNRKITTFNPAGERILRLDRESTINRTCEEVFGEGSPLDRLLSEMLRYETVISRREFELQRPSSPLPNAESALDWIQNERSRSTGERRHDRIWVGVTTSLLRDEPGKVIGATFVFTDLTEIKHLQEQVELKRRLTVLGEMSAGIAHEFRNFMGTIMGFAKLISKRLEPQDVRQGMVDAILREIQAMDRLIEQLLSFGRRAEVNLAPVNLEGFLHKQILSVLTQVPDHARPKLKVAIPADLPPVMIDEILLRQAIGNLLQNAIDAMPHGGELRVEVKVAAVPGSKEPGLHEVVLEIGDTGIGISKDALEKIFLPFFTTKEKGTGMGLALVHKIILSHNGRIEADGIEGQGATFRIYLPLSED